MMEIKNGVLMGIIGLVKLEGENQNDIEYNPPKKPLDSYDSV